MVKELELILNQEIVQRIVDKMKSTGRSHKISDQVRIAELEEILKMNDISKIFKKVIKKCITGDTTESKITIKITGHGGAFRPAGPR